MHKLFKKVSELEWYLTMQFYAEKRMNNGTYFNLPYQTIEEFYAYCKAIKPPIVWDETKKIGFFAPFDDSYCLQPMESVEIPLGFAIDESAGLIQPTPEKTLFSHFKVIGKGNGIGTILQITNISNEPLNFSIKKDYPICLFDISEEHNEKNQNSSCCMKETTDVPLENIKTKAFLDMYYST